MVVTAKSATVSVLCSWLDVGYSSTDQRGAVLDIQWPELRYNIVVILFFFVVSLLYSAMFSAVSYKFMAKARN